MNNKMMRSVILAVGFAATSLAVARSDVRDGNAMVGPVKADKYSIDGSTMGKAELYGYMGDLRDREHITGIVLKRGGNDDQRRVIGSIARTLELKAFEQDGRDLKPIDLPAVAPPPPPIENAAAPAAAAPPADADSSH
ncbi:MAG: hypothetical protein ABIR62_06235 [Dokdonella sp.]|uniref:hypothetical protein n=1 Tax=Dokdonella sp. TaxID=2291710 RepID=UPI003265539A